MDFLSELTGVAAALVAIVTLVYVAPLQTVYEFQRALKYVHGRYVMTLGPGRYWLFRFRTSLQIIDIRPRIVTLTGQEMITADGVSLRMSLVGTFAVAQPAKAVNEVQNYDEALHAALQVCLREVVCAQECEALLEDKNALSEAVFRLAAPQAAELGLELTKLAVRDVMFPGKLRESFAQVVVARKEGQAALERARGESAALRSLANTAKLAETHPRLLQLRALQALTESSGHTVILGVEAGGSVNEALRKRTQAGETPPEPS